MKTIEPDHSNAGNVYLDQVLMKQAAVDRELKPRQRAAPMEVALPATRAGGPTGYAVSAHGSPEPPAGRAADYRITGWGRWKTVVVPPNVYVVHTRRGYKDPINLGQGLSFGFNPYKDAFLIIPAAMQTIIINANCICAERQGVMVQAYVQWVIDDIGTAYRKLDFSDPEDPMRIVNVQLREQAEAAIKDKVATMPIDAVLSDKQPIIEELTHRLRTVAEGTRSGTDGSGGLGLKIVTVQIKEAIVSSTRLWENLQKPFRAEREMMARMAELGAQRSIESRELEIRKAQETATVETESELAELRGSKERASYDREANEKIRRHKLEQEATQRRISEASATSRMQKEAELQLALTEIEMERQRLERELERIRLRAEVDRVRAERVRARTVAETDVEELRHHALGLMQDRELERLEKRRTIENNVSNELLRSQLIDKLPQIASAIPAPKELRTVQIGSEQSVGGMAPLANLLASVLAVAEGVLKRVDPAAGN